MNALRRLADRPDFRAHPVRAIWRRIAWRVRWQLRREPWELPLRSDLRIRVPNGGPGALIYYQGASEPESATVVSELLGSGDSFVDVGAYIGEYTLLGGHAVGPTGTVHSFEPNPASFAMLAANVQFSGHTHLHPHNRAVSDVDGSADFVIRQEAALSGLRAGPSQLEGTTQVVEMMTLETFWRGRGTPPALIKVDVEGEELRVFRGAAPFLDAEPTLAPVWIFEWAPHNYRAAGHAPAEVTDLLSKHGFSLYRITRTGRLETVGAATLPVGTVNLVAAKSKGRLGPLLARG